MVAVKVGNQAIAVVGRRPTARSAIPLSSLMLPYWRRTWPAPLKVAGYLSTSPAQQAEPRRSVGRGWVNAVQEAAAPGRGPHRIRTDRHVRHIR